MANEYLRRTPTSTGNRRVFTWSGWVKKNEVEGGFGRFFESGAIGDRTYFTHTEFDEIRFSEQAAFSNRDSLVSNYKLRDSSSLCHVMIAVNTTLSNEDDRVKIYINGSLINNHGFSTDDPPGLNAIFQHNEEGETQYIGNSANQAADFQGYMSDVFHVDGQALTPDVFGKYDEGKGYISAGTTQATNFKKGQWIPKTPAIIKSVINARGGFGVNGFYLPMNSSNNFGADFHCTPNSILKLKENLPQPKAEIDGVGDYTGALRDDPFKDYLVLAIPGVSGGLQSGFGDYSAAIRGSGIAKSVTVATLNSTTPSISSSVSNYYGSSVYYPNNGTSTNGHLYVNNTDGFINGLNIPSASFTAEAWFYADSSAIANRPVLFSFGSTSDYRQFQLILDIGGKIRHIWSSTGSGWNYDITTTNQHVYADQWTHICFEKNQNTFTTYVNGVAVLVTEVNDTITYVPDRLVIGGHYRANIGSSPTGYYFSGYVQDVRVYTNIAKYKGGFDVPKPYTPINFANWRAVPDCTANNFSTMNSLYLFGSVNTSWVSNITLSDGNLSASWSSGVGSNQHTRSNFAMLSGKWYFEGKLNSTSGGDFGVAFENHINDSVGYGSDQLGFSYRNDGQKQNSTSATAYGSSYGTSDIIGVAFDADAGQITFYKNGVSQGVAFSGITIDQPAYFGCGKASSSTTQTASFNFGQNPTFSGNTTAGTFTDSNGKGLFKYEPPSGFLALCEDNLPTPAIKNPGEHFKTVLYTGDGNSGRSITGVGFKPDLVWMKKRDTTNADHWLFDSIRGPLNLLESSTGDPELNRSTSLQSFDNQGFSMGADPAYNTSGANYVAWCWKAGGPAITNTDGSITSQVSVNQDAGFSIVEYASTVTNGSSTIGHGLNNTPKFIINFGRRSSGDNWKVYHSSLTTNNNLILNSTSVQSTYSNYINDVNSSTFRMHAGTNANNNGIAYCWAEIEGFSKFGSYVGNGDPDGPFVYCGFKPAFVILKSSSAADNWRMYDSSRGSTNGISPVLYPNLSLVESAPTHIDFLSNGFKLRSDNNNGSGVTHIFIAFAESSFQYANSK